MTDSTADVRFDSAGGAIAGTLTLVNQPVAAALVITGSGKLNRDSDAFLGRTRIPLLSTGVTRQVTDALTAADVITLRYDKLGAGANRRAGHRLADRQAGADAAGGGHGDLPADQRRLQAVAAQAAGAAAGVRRRRDQDAGHPGQRALVPGVPQL
jgi:hypothetical protein